MRLARVPVRAAGTDAVLAAALFVTAGAFLAGCGGEPAEPSIAEAPAGDGQVSDETAADSVATPSAVDAEAAPTAAIVRGEELYRAGEYRLSIDVFVAAMDTAGAAGDSAGVAVALTWQGLAHYQLGDYDRAREVGTDALEMKERLGLASEIPTSLNALGLIAWQQGRLGDALDLHERSHRAAADVGDARGVARSLNNLALVQTDLGDLDGAIARYVEAAAAYRNLDRLDLEGRVLTNLGALRMELGDPVGAEESLSDAFELYARTGDPLGELNALGQLGAVRAAQGDPEAGLAALTTALAQAREMELRWEEASNLEQLANIHVDLGSSRLALDLYREANALNEELGLVYEQGANLRAQAGIQRAEGNLALATEQLERALSLHRAIGARAEELWDILHLAELSQEAGDVAAADAWMVEATALAGRLGHPRADLDVALTRAALAEARGNPNGVLSLVAEVSMMLHRAPLDVQWRLALHEAHARAALGHDGALAAARHAATLVDRLRGAIGSDLLRNGVAQARSDTYHLLVTLLLDRGHVDAAFLATEAARSTATLRRLAAAPGEGLGDRERAVAALLERVGQLDAALAGRYRSLYGDDSDAFVLREMAELEAQRASLLDQLAEAGVEFVAERDGAPAPPAAPLDLDALKSSLADDEAVVTWLESAEELVAFAVRADTIAVRRVPVSRSALSSRVRVARALISDTHRFATEGQSFMSALHEVLLGPLAASGGILADVDHLVIITDGSLSYLPFAALVDPSAGDYLIERRTLSAVPSASALVALRARTRVEWARPGEAWVGAGFAPTPDDLPGTLGEVEDFVGQVPGRALVGDEATEAELRSALEAGMVVHAAAHGRMNARNPLFTRLQLAPGSGDPDDDGLLHVHELLQLTSRSPLVFLSACETGLASSWAPGVIGGRDLSTLAQALLYGGAGSVVATLWMVEDQAAARLSRWFYQALPSGDPASALADAQRRMIGSEATAAPFFWAGYVVQGPGSAPAQGP